MLSTTGDELAPAASRRRRDAALLGNAFLTLLQPPPDYRKFRKGGEGGEIRCTSVNKRIDYVTLRTTTSKYSY
ncbi:unnamed protein product [Danaus chrysippus]|uniref:(African queen) hypothetical protein n=1 Tax=Danaus chrysippus TaxID=151541 RepID=A0A8J2VVE2_9NEOP|nr:unnamed protein product [Danaus chrysippus]